MFANITEVTKSIQQKYCQYQWVCQMSNKKHMLDPYASKQESYAATDVLFILVLKKSTTFKCRLVFWPPDVSK
jgi:hypothetical protein